MANSFKAKRSSAVGTSLTQVGSYVVPGATIATAIGLILANTSNVSIAVSATHYDGTTDVYLVKDATLVPGGAMTVSGMDQKLVLEAGQSIRVKSSAAASLDVVLSILEIS